MRPTGSPSFKARKKHQGPKVNKALCLGLRVLAMSTLNGGTQLGSSLYNCQGRFTKARRSRAVVRGITLTIISHLPKDNCNIHYSTKKNVIPLFPGSTLGTVPFVPFHGIIKAQKKPYHLTG